MDRDDVQRNTTMEARWRECTDGHRYLSTLGNCPECSKKGVVDAGTVVWSEAGPQEKIVTLDPDRNRRS